MKKPETLYEIFSAQADREQNKKQGEKMNSEIDQMIERLKEQLASDWDKYKETERKIEKLRKERAEIAKAEGS